MFTVKHIMPALTSDTQAESLYYGTEVKFCPTGQHGALEVWEDGRLMAGLWGGTAYVMNPEGKTVARYDLPYQGIEEMTAKNPRPISDVRSANTNTRGQGISTWGFAAEPLKDAGRI